MDYSNNKNAELDLEVIQSKQETLVSIVPPKSIQGVKRTAVDLCCVIDVSGSMASEAKVQNEEGKAEGFGLSTLDLVKHAVRTMIASLTKNDRLAIVSFSDNAHVELWMTEMDDHGKKKAEVILDKLKPDASTNIWDGLSTGLDLLLPKDGESNERNRALFMLTDGVPNIIPPRGHEEMFKIYKEKKGLPAIVNTFGFGYCLDSKLLEHLAKEGHGTYAFIPDGGFVGTIFINSLSNLLTTIATEVTLTIKLNSDKLDITDFSLVSQHNYSYNKEEKELCLKLGSVIIGQTNDFVLNLNGIESGECIKASLGYSSPLLKGKQLISRNFILQPQESAKVEVERLRLFSANAIFKTQAAYNKDKLAEIQIKLKDIINELKASFAADDKLVLDLINDLEGQVTLAFSKDEFFNKWGKHYLPSLSRAYLLQQCNNFKDYAVQHFGGLAFKEIRDSIDELFLKIPPPKPSIKKENKNKNKNNKPAKPVNMKNYYNPSGGCFDGDCVVKMWDGSSKKVKEIVKNDEILGENGQKIKVICVVKTECKENKIQFVEIGGLKITPYHPIRINGNFVFPISLGQEKEFECQEMFDFVLESSHIIKISDIECVTLGHGFNQNEIVRHEFFGSNRVIEHLKRYPGWEDGLVKIMHNDIVRDEKTMMITELCSNRNHLETKID